MSFLSQVVHLLLEKKKQNFEECAIIIPNQRARRLLQKELSEKIGKTTFLPQIYTISDFIFLLSDLKKIEKNRLLFLLYEVYLKNCTAKKDSFVNFTSWGTLFLQDINEIDMQLVKGEEVFVNLSEIKKMETSFAKTQLSENQQHYIDFYQSLRTIYKDFQEKLIAQHIGYEGLIYKDVAENIAHYTSKISAKNYFFVGFNALSPSELAILRYFKENFSTEFLFDLDHFYYDSCNKENQIQQQINHIATALNLSEITTIGDYYSTIPKEISIVGVSQQVSQVMYVADLLQKMSPEQLNTTAVVLADESLLIPFVHAYDCTNANVTMGYPIQTFPIYHLLESIITLIKNSERFRTVDELKTPLYYNKDILTFYQNSLIKSTFFKDNAQHQDFIQKELVDKNRIFFNFKDIPIIESLKFPDFTKEGKEILDEICSFFEQIKEKIEEKEKLFADIIIRELKIIETLLQEFENIIPVDIHLINSLLSNNLQGKTIPMLGNPAEGLQVMGMLETRSLDFDRLIILSANEGVIPHGKVHNSLILFDVKKHFKLPTYHEKDAIYAYHFFRLLQRAKGVHILYDNDSKNSVAEKSRFVRQLEFEVKNQKLENQISIKEEEIYILPKTDKVFSEIDVEKDEKMLKLLKNMRYSPSKLLQYINCPLQFYLAHVAEITPTKEVSEEIEYALLGTVIHKVLENLVKEIQNNSSKSLTVIGDYTANLEEKLYDIFKEEHIEKSELQRGKYYLAFEVIKKYLYAYFKQLKKELSEMSVIFEGAEKKLAGEINVENDTSIKISGVADRVEIRDGQVLILDYKTGRVPVDKLTISSDLAAIFSDSAYKQAFQLLCYAYLYRKILSDNNKVLSSEGIESGIISLQSLMPQSQEYIHRLKIKDENKVSTIITDDILNQFEDELIKLLRKIISPEENFTQTAVVENCQYCDYAFLCGR